MTGEAQFGDFGDEARAAELEAVSQETLSSLLEGIRSRCPENLLKWGSGGVSFWGWDIELNGTPIKLDLYYYGDNEGPTVHDTDGSIAGDTTGRYKHSHDIFYSDTGVQATIFKTEKADESQPDSKEVITFYTIMKDGEQLEVEKRIRPLALPIFLKLNDELVPAENNPPIVPAEEQRASEQQENELGLNVVSEAEARAYIELLRTI